MITKIIKSTRIINHSLFKKHIELIAFPINQYTQENKYYFKNEKPKTPFDSNKPL